MDIILYFVRDTLSGTIYFIYAFIIVILMFAIIGHLLKDKYAKLNIKLATAQNPETTGNQREQTNINQPIEESNNLNNVQNNEQSNLDESLNNFINLNQEIKNNNQNNVSENINNLVKESSNNLETNIVTKGNDLKYNYQMVESYEPTKKVNPKPMPNPESDNVITPDTLPNLKPEEVIKPEPMPNNTSETTEVPLAEQDLKLNESIPELKL